jgi:2'-5' RNA ligase
MHRLFVAIRPPAQIRDRLIDLMEGVEGARWQDEDQLHLTLRFIGEVDRHGVADIEGALGAIRHPPFRIALNGLGTFGRRGKASSLWAGLTPHDQLKSLHKKVDQALQRVGLEPEHRAYLPHITIARLGRLSGPVQELLNSAAGLASDPFPVDRFRLYESILSPAGAHYMIVQDYPLG